MLVLVLETREKSQKDNYIPSETKEAPSSVSDYLESCFEFIEMQFEYFLTYHRT